MFPYLLDIFNASLSTGSFPSSWKRSFITPIPKTPNPSQPSDFRPISILPEISKVLERIVLKDVLSYVRKNQLQDHNQFAYTPGLSTQDALLRLITDIRSAEDNNLLTLVTCFDLSKAFDTVDHALLLSKLTTFRFSASVIRWFASYLSGRTQAVKLTDRISNWLETPSGVPQGSVLGPFLFSIFIKDLDEAIAHCKIIKYADDILIYYHFHHTAASEARRKIQIDVDSITGWINSNGLVLNPEKTRCMVFGSPLSL